MAIQTATQYFGFAVTPILGGWFSSIGTIKFPFGEVDSESMPAFIMAIVCIVTMIGLIFMQEPVTRNVATVPPLPVTLHHSTSKDEIKSHSIAFFVFIALNVLTRMALSVMETLGGMLFGQVFPSSSALGTGVYYGVLGFIGMAVLIGIIFLSKRVQDSFLLLGGLILMELGQLFLISNDIGAARFVIGTGITWAIGFPLAQTLVVSMFSKVVTSPKQVRTTCQSVILIVLTFILSGSHDGLDRCWWFARSRDWSYYLWLHLRCEWIRIHFLVCSRLFACRPRSPWS